MTYELLQAFALIMSVIVVVSLIAGGFVTK